MADRVPPAAPASPNKAVERQIAEQRARQIHAPGVVHRDVPPAKSDQKR